MNIPASENALAAKMIPKQSARIITDYRNVANGMTIDNCAFFGGGIRIDNCKGVSITSSIIVCNVKTIGDGVNRIANNYIISQGESFEFCPTTIIENNFTDAGSWEKNRPR